MLWLLVTYLQNEIHSSKACLISTVLHDKISKLRQAASLILLWFHWLPVLAPFFCARSLPLSSPPL